MTVGERELVKRIRLRPRDAATIILIDRSTGGPKVLMGRRAKAHVFMPDVYVFPGGRRDRTDSRLPYCHDANPEVLNRLCREGLPESRARGIALAAIRELREETGLWIGDGVQADLSTLRYVARAITPPGNVRRFDTRFFCTFMDQTEMDHTALHDSDEMSDLHWVDMETVSGLNMASITKMILGDVAGLMHSDPNLSFGLGGPFYRERRGQFVRDSI